MRRNTRNLSLLAALVAALAAAVYAELARESARASAPLTLLDLAAVQQLEVRCAAVCLTRRFARDAQGWQMLEPYHARADDAAVARLLAIAHAPVRVRLTLKDYDPARLGLAPALVNLMLDQTVIAIGDEDPIEHDRYVRVGADLARVPDRFSARLFEAPENELAAAGASAPPNP